MEGEIAKRNRCGNRFNHSNFRTVARNGEIDYLIKNWITMTNEKHQNRANYKLRDANLLLGPKLSRWMAYSYDVQT